MSIGEEEQSCPAGNQATRHDGFRFPWVSSTVDDPNDHP